MAKYLVDADGTIVDTGLSKLAAYRLAWRCMNTSTYRIVDICSMRNVCHPTVVWMRCGHRWVREVG